MTNPISNTLAVTEVTDRMDKKSDEAGSAATAAKADSKPTDQVSLTDKAQQIGQIVQAASEQPDVDVDKVNAIRAALESGDYRIDAGRIADGLLGFEKNVSGKQ